MRRVSARTQFTDRFQEFLRAEEELSFADSIAVAENVLRMQVKDLLSEEAGLLEMSALGKAWYDYLVGSSNSSPGGEK